MHHNIIITIHSIIFSTDFDMNVLQERLKEQKRMRQKAAKNRTPPSQRKGQYTPIDLDNGSDEVKIDSATDSESSGDGASRQKLKQLPTAPIKPLKSPSSSTSEGETTPKKKPLPPPPAKKPTEPPKSNLAPKREDTSALPAPPPQSLIDRMNQPLPPTPGEQPLSPPTTQSGRFKPPSPSANSPAPQRGHSSMSQAAQPVALLKEMVAKRGKASADGTDTRTAKKKQPIPVPKQRPPSKKPAAPTDSSSEVVHEPAGYANLPAHDAPYQNMGFGPDKDAQPQEPEAMYENIHKRAPNRKQPAKKYVNSTKNMGGADSSGGSEYQNVNASRRPRP